MQFNYKLRYLGIILILISGYFFLYFFSDLLQGHTLCIFKMVTGIPCPACGSVRATLLLSEGRLPESVMVNPLGIITNILILVSIIWMIIDIVKGKETYFPVLKKDWDRRIKVILFMVLLINWIWNIKKGL